VAAADRVVASFCAERHGQIAQEGGSCQINWTKVGSTQLRRVSVARYVIACTESTIWMNGIRLWFKYWPANVIHRQLFTGDRITDLIAFTSPIN
jgi:hypothetical protein